MPTGVYVRTEINKANIGSAMIGHKSHNIKGKESWMFGLKREKHPCWKGGTVSTNKKYAMLRDNYTRQKCGHADREVLTVDRIVPAGANPALAKDMDNMITLCANCHMKKTRQDHRNKVYLNEVYKPILI